MYEENISQGVRLKNVDDTRNYFITQIYQNELMSKKHKKVLKVLNYIDDFLTVTSTITGCVSIPAFASLVGISIGITSSTIRLKNCVTTAGIKKYTSVIKKKKKKDDKTVLLAKCKLNRTEVLIFKALIDSNISHDESVFINNVLK